MVSAFVALSYFGYAVCGGTLMQTALDARRDYQSTLDDARRIARDPRTHGLARANTAVESTWQIYEGFMKMLPIAAQLSVERAWENRR
jgi:hypothetical protein